jgi:hypothetical protein
MAEKQKKLYLDVPKLIEIHNKNNPNDIVDREGFAKKFETTYQTLTNYNGGVIPKSLELVNKILTVSKAKYEDVFVEVGKEKIQEPKPEKQNPFPDSLQKAINEIGGDEIIQILTKRKK